MNKETPHFIFREKKLEENYREFERLCEKHVGDYVIAYSIKTNGFGALINKLHELGSNFEVASMEEIMKTPEKSKVFNGPCKTEEELQMAIDGRFLINIDSKSEIDRIVKLREGKEFNVSLRVSLDEGKFGFESNKLEETIDYCFMNNLKVIGLSFHPGTQKNFRLYGDYIRQVEKVIENIKDKVELKYLDIGGGFPDKIQLKNLGVGLEDYFKLIASLKKFNTKMVFEPGRFLVADAFELITKINVIKQKDGKNYAILDAGINLLSKITLAKYWFKKIQNPILNNKLPHSDKQNENEYILAGPLLFGNDIIGRFKGNLKEGDLMKVTNVGAYCFNLAWEISYRKPRVFIE
jgi:diaminopimelate decarboxylase